MESSQAAVVIDQLLLGKSVTFAHLVYSRTEPVAAMHKDKVVEVVVKTNIQLFSNINAATSVFANAVKKSAGKLGVDVPEYVPLSTFYEHSLNCYSIVKHKTNNKLFLYFIVNKELSREYFIDGVQATVKDVAQLKSPAAARKFLSSNDEVTTQGVTHTVKLRVLELEKILSISACNERIKL